MDVVRGGGFRIVPLIPLVDAHAIDRAYSLNGIGQPALVQIKTSGSMDAVGRYHWTFRASSVQHLDGVSAVLAVCDSHGWPAGDIYWCLDGAAVRKVASKEYDRALRAEVYQLNAYPEREDRLSAYRCTRDELSGRLFPGQRLAPTMPLAFPTLELDQGGIYEFATITDIMIGNRKDLLIFRPAFDLHGRDVLIQLLGSSRSAYLQIKGTALLRGDDQARVHISRSTFKAADDFWVVMRVWNRRTDAMHPECWLVSSEELQHRTKGDGDVRAYVLDIHLDPSKDRWADRRYPANQLAAVLRSALTDARLAA